MKSRVEIDPPWHRYWNESANSRLSLSTQMSSMAHFTEQNHSDITAGTCYIGPLISNPFYEMIQTTIIWPQGSDAGRWKTLEVPVLIGGDNLPSPVGIQ